MSVVTFDAVGPSSAGTSVIGITTTLSWNHATANFPNRILVIVIALGDGATTAGPKIVSGITCDGVAMTALQTVNAGGGTEGFVTIYYILGQAVGTNALVATQTNPGNLTTLIAGSVSLYNVDQQTPINRIISGYDPNVISTSPSIIVPSSVNNMVLAGECNGSNIPVATQTTRWSKAGNTSSKGGNAGCSTAAGGSSITMGYTTTSDHWAMLGIDINAEGALGPDFDLTPGSCITYRDN